MRRRREVYNWCTTLLCLLAGVMLMGLMIWHVYEADDLAGALIMGMVLMAMVSREAYHQSRPARSAERRIKNE